MSQSEIKTDFLEASPDAKMKRIIEAVCASLDDISDNEIEEYSDWLKEHKQNAMG